MIASARDALSPDTRDSSEAEAVLTQSRRKMEAALVQGCTLTRAKSLLSSSRHQNLTSFNDRIAEFIADQFPEDGSPVELLFNHNGTYVIPFPCHRVADAWRNFETHEIIEADVAGWRLRSRKVPIKFGG